MGLERLDFRYAYSFCSEVQATVLGDNEPDTEYPEYFLPPNHELVRKASVPQRTTLLHDYIYDVAAEGIDYVIGHADAEGFMTYGPMIAAAGLAVPEWMTYGEIEDHKYELDVLAREAARLLVPAAFQLLYADLRFLQAFQRLVATRISTFRYVDYPEQLQRDGVLVRPGYWPTWLRRGVFFRDKGRCQNCYRDLTGTVNLGATIHLDHILPLARGGTNDPTNLQALCDGCNLRKSADDPEGNWHTETYWELDAD